MRLLPRFSSALALLAVLGLITVAVPQARAVATHVVISEVSTRWSNAYDEFVELYNPTSSAISLSGWKMQYSSAASGSTWQDYVTLSAGATIPAHGFFLLAGPLVVLALRFALRVSGETTASEIEPLVVSAARPSFATSAPPTAPTSTACRSARPCCTTARSSSSEPHG